MAARYESGSFFKLSPCDFPLGSLLESGPAGRAVPHGSEANLPEAEAHIQVRYGKDVLCVDDVGPL